MSRIHRPLPIALGEERPQVHCLDCGRCCTYVAVGINAPTTPRYATDILWYLYHENVAVYRQAAGSWSVLFETTCRQLAPDNRCRVYERRPHICRGFDEMGCEVNTYDHGVTFREPAAFLEWLRAKKPALHRTLLRRYLPRAR